MKIAMIAPGKEQCGIADYTTYLLAALRHWVEVSIVTDAAGFAPKMNAVDLVHIQHQYFLFGGVAPWKSRFGQLADRLRVPAVMTVHEFVEPKGSPAFRLAIQVTNRLHFHHPAVRRLIVHTETDRQRMIESGLEAERIVVVRHGVPPAPPLPPREEARQSLGVEGRFVVTLFGFLSRRKGHLLALEALKQLPSSVLLLFAGGKHPDDRTTYVEKLTRFNEVGGFANRARITGYLPPEQVAVVMSATDLVIAPFTQSSGSGSLALAFACGKPILASDIGPHREINQISPHALTLFAAGDATALANAILELQESTARLAMMAEGARRYAAMHSYVHMAAKTVEVYRSVLAEQS